MSSIGTGYDQSSTTFSPDGRVFQVEYAQKAVDNSGTAVGIKCKDGVILAVEKLVLSKMLMPGSNRRIFNIDKKCGMAVSGLMADARQIVNRARSESKQYKSFYGGGIPGQILADRISMFMHAYTLYWHVRPFGVAALFASYGDEGPQLHAIEPSGICYRFYAAAIGKGTNAAKASLEKLKFDEMTCREAAIEAAKIIYAVHDDIKDKDFELELSWICQESGFVHQMVPADLQAEAERVAKQNLEDMDDD